MENCRHSRAISCARPARTLHTEREPSALSLSNVIPKSTHVEVTHISLSPEIQELHGIISTFTQSDNTVRQQYGAGLMQSVLALQKSEVKKKKGEGPVSQKVFSEQISKAQTVIEKQFALLCKALERDDPRLHWLQQGGLWPTVTTISLLEHLRSVNLYLW